MPNKYSMLAEIEQLADKDQGIAQESKEYLAESYQYVAQKQLEALDAQKHFLHIRIKKVLAELYSELRAIEMIEQQIRESMKQYEPIQEEPEKIDIIEHSKQFAEQALRELESK